MTYTNMLSLAPTAGLVAAAIAVRLGWRAVVVRRLLFSPAARAAQHIASVVAPDFDADWLALVDPDIKDSFDSLSRAYDRAALDPADTAADAKVDELEAGFAALCRSRGFSPGPFGEPSLGST
jgi:hypothetical protein